MLVYGDPARRCAPADLLADIRADLARAEAADGLNRHAALVSALITAGELWQGIADAEFAERGCDAPSPAQTSMGELALELARLVRRSWLSLPAHPGESRDPGFFDPEARRQEKTWTPAFAGVSGKVGALSELGPDQIRVKQPEGYAFYALYPEAYLQSAASLPPGEWRVLGLRSIGTSLAAVVAAALDAAPPLTLRPVGHPFDRRLGAAPELAAELRAASHVAVVDEGPGLSGSSFGAALDLLEAEGVARERIHVFPGHGGDLGPQASEAHRARWRDLPRHFVSTDALLLDSGRLQAWVTGLVSPAVEPMGDLSGGAWRALRYAAEDDWPPVNAAQERRKFLHRTRDGTWLVKFAGLGGIGERKLERARALDAAGFSAEPAGFLHGWLVERWIEPAPAASPPISRLSEYLRFRAQQFTGGAGASIEQLFEMLRVNAAEGLGPDAASAAERFRPDLPRLQALVRPVETDNRLHAWEWVTAPDGCVLKTDALDHHAAHDLVGAQDIAWDVAGAAVEFDLDPDDAARLARETGAATELLPFMTAAYCAFQLGWWWMAAEAQAGWPAEAGRLARRRDLYAGRLSTLLDA